MIRTKFATLYLEELVELMIKFDENLHDWTEENQSSTWDTEVLIGDYEYQIIITVYDEEDNDTSRDDS
tara:strand:- start:1544 stop:1747 length:204 start_codon:yes stop_codon:yes gene_type:complete